MKGKVNTRIYVRILLQLFVQISKRNAITPPLFNSQNKTSPAVQRWKRFCREFRHIYTLYAQHAPKSNMYFVFVIFCTRLSEPQ